MTSLIVSYGLIVLFLLVGIESAGVPLPGETALVSAAVLAHDHWGIEWVIAVAAIAAIIGDNVGYWLGRTGGRKLIDRFELTRRYADKALPPSERFFERHGGKTIFLARFIAVLRVTAAWLAGITRMHWWKFFLWNAAGGITWATAMTALGYSFAASLGTVETYVGRGGAIAAGVVLLGALLYGLHRLSHRRSPAADAD